MLRKLIASAILGASIVAGSLVGAGSASALTYASEICSKLDANPTKAAIVAIAVEDITDGESSNDMAMQFAKAAVVTCPRHDALIERVMDEFANGDLS